MLLILFGTSIAYFWSPSLWVSALYWYYENYGFNVCVISFSFYSIQLLSWLIFLGGPASRLRNINRHVWVRYIDTTKITVACMSSLIFSIDIRRICYFIMFYFKLTNGSMVKWCIFKWCNGEINNRTGHLFSHKYWICPFVLFLNTTFLQQTKQFIIFNIWSLTTSTAIKFIS